MIRFVTGTDTGVGKTMVSAWLGARARAEGLSVRYAKPVQTGLAPGEHGSDADVVAAFGVEAHELLRYPEPLAPAVAAELAGERIDARALVREVRTLADGRDLLLVEGAGGLLVPMSDGWTMADLALALDAELVVAARPGLGTINHTALTLEAAAARGLGVALIAVGPWPAHPDLTQRTNLERLRSMGAPVETVPYLAQPAPTISSTAAP